MNRIRAVAVCVALAAIACVAGCGFLGPQIDRSKFFLLVAQAATSNEAEAASGVAVGLGPLKFPDYLQRSEIATRISDTRVDYSKRDLWAEPLERNFVRVLSEDVAATL